MRHRAFHYLRYTEVESPTKLRTHGKNAGAPAVEPPNPIIRVGDERARNGMFTQPISTKFLLESQICAEMKDFFQF